MSQEILVLDKAWIPHQWMSIPDAMILEAKGCVLDHLGEDVTIYTGGINRISGERSFLETSSIIVVNGESTNKRFKSPTLTNSGLFQRDLHICAYCGMTFVSSELTRDHIHPVSKGGKDTWTNVVTACKACNSMKGDILPGEKLPKSHGVQVWGPQGTGRMDPLYVPYQPCPAEHLIMKNRRIKIDQMEFLLERVTNKKSRIFDYAAKLFN